MRPWHALDHHVERLAQDHEHARVLAQGLQGLPGIAVSTPQTNIVFIDILPAAQAEMARRHPQGLPAALKDSGLLCTGLYRLRLVTHLDVDRAAIDQAVSILRRALSPAA